MVNIGVCAHDSKLSISTEGSTVFMFGFEPVFALVFDFASVLGVYACTCIYYCVYLFSLIGIGIVNLIVCCCCCCCLRERM